MKPMPPHLKTTLRVCALACALTLPHTSQAATSQASTYQCDKLHRLVVRYYEAQGDKPDFVKLTIKNKQYTLPRAPAASGIRYSDEKHYEWWGKGEEGSLTDISKKQGATFSCKEVVAHPR